MTCQIPKNHPLFFGCMGDHGRGILGLFEDAVPVDPAPSRASTLTFLKIDVQMRKPRKFNRKDAKYAKFTHFRCA